MTEEKCHHWWIIEEAQGPTSVGICKYCKARKVFANSVRWERQYKPIMPDGMEEDELNEVNTL